uniref:Uncharacterized protein n=1 Tax=Cuerna arida TaxID=1464854 RepID=A0A1B6GUP6_9HEMI
MEDFVKTLDKGTTFGHVKESDFQTLETERLRQDQKRKEDLERQEQLRKIELEEKQKQEHEDYLLAIEEQNRFDHESKQKHSLMQNISPKSFGRGIIIRQLMKDKELREQKDKELREQNLPIQRHGDRITEYIRQSTATCGAESVQGNQLPDWMIKPLTQVSSSCSTDSSEQFEDVQNSSSSAQHSPQSFMLPEHTNSSATSSKTASPVEPSTTLPLFTSKEIYPPLKESVSVQLWEDDFPPLPVSSSKRKHRKPRIAAKFSNTFLNEEVQCPTEDRWAILASSTPRLIPNTLPASKSVSINNLRPSQRIISSNLLKPSDIQNSSQPGFIMDENNFPAL